jgi:hypothetical protein
LIDDRPVNGAKEFTGEFIHFGSEGFETWDEVLLYIINKENIDLNSSIGVKKFREEELSGPALEIFRNQKK